MDFSIEEPFHIATIPAPSFEPLEIEELQEQLAVPVTHPSDAADTESGSAGGGEANATVLRLQDFLRRHKKKPKDAAVRTRAALVVQAYQALDNMEAEHATRGAGIDVKG
jgi:hypothetical protein